MIHPSNDTSQSGGKPDHAALKAELKGLEPISRRSTSTFSLKSYVRQHYDDLKEAHDKGYTWSALTQIVESKLQVEIASETLRKYMAAIRKERGEPKAESSKSTPQNISVHHKERSFPLPKNLQPSVDREFRRTSWRNES